MKNKAKENALDDQIKRLYERLKEKKEEKKRLQHMNRQAEQRRLDRCHMLFGEFLAKTAKAEWFPIIREKVLAEEEELTKVAGQGSGAVRDKTDCNMLLEFLEELASQKSK